MDSLFALAIKTGLVRTGFVKTGLETSAAESPHSPG